jgi:hypothetical protein
VRWITRRVLLEMLPAGGVLPGLDTVDLDGFLRNFGRDAPFLMRLGLTLSVAVFVMATPITLGIPWPAIWLPKKLRATHAGRLANHRIYMLRQALTLLKMIAGMAWGQDPAIRTRVGLDPYDEDPGTWRPAS